MPRRVDSEPTMAAEEFRTIRHELRLSPEELAPMLGYAPRRQTITQMEVATASARTIPPAVARLMRAYAAGYRPDDWPQRDRRKVQNR
jgi:hypothetical protein